MRSPQREAHPIAPNPTAVAGSQRGASFTLQLLQVVKGFLVCWAQIQPFNSWFNPINLMTVALICPETHGTPGSLWLPPRDLDLSLLIRAEQIRPRGTVPAPREVSQPRGTVPNPRDCPRPEGGVPAPRDCPSPKATQQPPRARQDRLEEKLFPNTAHPEPAAQPQIFFPSQNIFQDFIII